jgi:phospholipid-binding lipoprotein MlaA
MAFVVGIAFALALGGCGTLSGALRADSAVLAGPTAEERDALAPAPLAESVPSLAAVPENVPPAPVAGDSSREEAVPAIAVVAPVVADDEVVMAQPRSEDAASDTAENEYDPWEPFNEKMFNFNLKLDKYVLKPVAKAYSVVMPEPFQLMISNGFDNISFVPRLINSLLQAKWGGAGRELSRFLINSTAGLGGLFDPAKDYWKIEKSREDFGQTLGVWGASPGPYIIVPFMEPLTVRDGVGKFVDSFMDPLSYFIPFIWDRLGMKVGDTVNERALNLDLYQGFEESVIDMYSAVRHGYLQRRERLIRE